MTQRPTRCSSGLARKASKSGVTEEVSPGIMLDFDSEGRVIGIEVLDVSGRMMSPNAAA